MPAKKKSPAKGAPIKSRPTGDLLKAREDSPIQRPPGAEWMAGFSLECGRLASAFPQAACCRFPAGSRRRVESSLKSTRASPLPKAEASRPHSKMPSASSFSAKYSVLQNRRQILTEEERQREIERERRLIEDRMPAK